MKINLEPRKTNELELWKTILEPWKTMKTNLEPWKINLEPWNMKHDIYQLNWIRLGGPHYLRTSATTLQYFSNIFLHFCNTFHLHWLKNVALLTRRPNWPPWLKKNVTLLIREIAWSGNENRKRKGGKLVRRNGSRIWRKRQIFGSKKIEGGGEQKRWIGISFVIKIYYLSFIIYHLSSVFSMP